MYIASWPGVIQCWPHRICYTCSFTRCLFHVYVYNSVHMSILLSCFNRISCNSIYRRTFLFKIWFVLFLWLMYCSTDIDCIFTWCTCQKWRNNDVQSVIILISMPLFSLCVWFICNQKCFHIRTLRIIMIQLAIVCNFENLWYYITIPMFLRQNSLDMHVIPNVIDILLDNFAHVRPIRNAEGCISLNMNSETHSIICQFHLKCVSGLNHPTPNWNRIGKW